MGGCVDPNFIFFSKITFPTHEQRRWLSLSNLLSHGSWLLYAYPWIPFPRRVIVYLRERGILDSLVKVVQVSDTQSGNHQFLEFTKDCYGVDMTIGSGEKVLDVYGREVVEDFPKLTEFYAAFRTPESVRIDVSAGEVAFEKVLKRAQTWAPGFL